MDRAASLIFPGSKTLVGWWGQLASYRPQALWIGYGFLHRIEAPVTILRELPVDPFLDMVLQALTLEPASGVALKNLQARLHLPTAVLQPILSEMQTLGFVARREDQWQMTPAGAQALARKQFPTQVQERRVFPFLESLDAAGQRLGPAQFLAIAECAHAPWQVDDAHRFDRAWLKAAVEQSAEWKASLAFPGDVTALVQNTAEDVLVDRAERALVVFLLSGAELLGFAAKVDGWTLSQRTPAVRLPASACAHWPERFQEPASSVWQDAWRDWCRQRQLPTNEVEICSLSYRPPRLEVQAPQRLVQRLQASKNDLLRGEAWLLVGAGYNRTAAQLALK